MGRGLCFRRDGHHGLCEEGCPPGASGELEAACPVARTGVLGKRGGFATREAGGRAHNDGSGPWFRHRREANLRVRRAEGGSRFNVRYRRGIPSDAMTPNGLIDALSPYIDFGGGTHASSTNASRPAAPSGSPMLTLKKGMSIADVEALLGPANTATESKEGVLTLMRRTYTNESNRIITSFVNGVMIDFVIAPQ